MPCFIRACDRCCTNVFIRLNPRARARAVSEVPREIAVVTVGGSGRAKGVGEDRGQGEAEQAKEKASGGPGLSGGDGRGRGWKENCAWIVFPLPRPEENL